MPNITCPHCQHEFYMANHLDETSHTASIASLEDRIYELEHSERLSNLESNQLRHSNRLVDLQSEVEDLRRLIDSKASARTSYPDQRWLEDNQGWFEDQLKTALEEIEWLKERVEDIERAVTQQRAQMPEHLAQALSPEQIEKVLRDTAEKKTIDVAAELRERIEKLENALHSRLLELEKAVFERPWGDKASAAREEAIEDRVEKLEQSFQAFVPPAIEDRVQKLEEQLFGHRLWNFEQQKKANMRTADISDLIDSKTTAEKLNYIVETLSRLGYDWPAILKWLNMHPEIDLAYAEAYRYTETTN